ncbi:ATP-binding protein [Sphingomonas canadensis]|uniref:histidine kinase n=1 Tax=Sphingomonas canadensis TaxID=1219257 RepID=A0ABW3H684_9SPHN|nr:ATP-binding protein [Sphingomonas canadensis]MCW3836465.1 ATP-binding protein [Sphingomonas canadensis]
MKQAGAQGPATPLFLRIFLLMLACVAVVQTLNLALLVAVQPPPPRLYLVGDIARALEEGRDATGELRFTGREKTDPSIWAPRADRIRPALAMVLGVPEDRVEFGFASPPFPQRAPAYDRRALPPPAIPRDLISARNYLVLDDFVASLRRDDGTWVTVRPARHAFELWRWFGLLWLLFTAIAVVPFAWWLARRLAKPIGAFAAAAERLGRDPRAAPLEVSGPPEIADAAVAFNQMQARLNRYVDDRAMVVGAIAHDLRTPLMRLELRLEGAPAKLRKACEADIHDMESMIAAALAYVRDTSQAVGRRPLDLRTLIESVTDDYADRGAEVSFAPGGPLVIDGNSAGLKAMLSNLVGNALKYAGSAEVKLSSGAGQAVIEVCDHGPGIPPDELDRMFEPFFRGERSRSRDTGGFGLGLASARAVARGHGGDVTLENRPQGGLRAVVTLPA